jgi:hypothetical protein
MEDLDILFDEEIENGIIKGYEENKINPEEGKVSAKNPEIYQVSNDTSDNQKNIFPPCQIV